MSDLPESARKLRERLGLSQEEMADRIGYTRQHYNELEGGKRAWSKRARKALSILEMESDTEGSPNSDNVSESPAPYLAEVDASDIRATLQEVFLAARSPDSPSALSRIGSHLLPWLEAAREDPDIAGYVISQIRLHLNPMILEKLRTEGTDGVEEDDFDFGPKPKLAPPEQRVLRPAPEGAAARARAAADRRVSGS